MMKRTLLNRVAIRQEIDRFIQKYQHENTQPLEFTTLIQYLESQLKELIQAQSLFIISIDESDQTLTLLGRDEERYIENIEGTFSIILESYYSQKVQHIHNIKSNFLYNESLDQLVEYPLKELAVIPIVCHRGNTIALVWLAHSKQSKESFESIDFDNVQHFGTIIENILIHKKVPLQSQEETQNDQLNILIVDDDIIILKFLSAVLREQGFAVEIAHSGREALKLYQCHKFDLIFMDEVMNGGMHGHQAVSKIREIEASNNLKAIPILALTSDTTKETRERLLEAGVQQVLYKPIDPDKILDAMIKVSDIK